MDMMHLLRSGGPAMVPIALASVVTLALIIEQTVAMSRARKHLQWLWQFPERRDQLLTQKPTDVVTLYLTEALHANYRTMDERFRLASELLASQERRITWLGTIASIAPLLGLLGTVSGMIAIFFRIASAAPQNPLTDLSQGISEALVATAAGLVVAIIAALGNHKLMNSNDDLAADLESWLREHETATGGKSFAHQTK